MANQNGRALFGFIENMAVRTSKTGSEYVRATLVSTYKNGDVSFKTQIIAFAPKNDSSKNPVTALKALGNNARVRVYGFMEDVDQNGKYTIPMMRVIDARENNSDGTAKAKTETTAETQQSNDVEVPF